MLRFIERSTAVYGTEQCYFILTAVEWNLQNVHVLYAYIKLNYGPSIVKYAIDHKSMIEEWDE